MNNREMLMILAILVLFVSTILFAIQSNNRAAELDEAKELSATLSSYLKERQNHQLHTPCRSVGEGRYSILNGCLLAIDEAADLSKLFSREDFKNPRDGEAGYFIIQNEKGGETFNSEKFSLFLNNQLVESGCSTPGEIAPGFTCRFDLTTRCEPGDNLEIKYEEKRAFLFIC
jgi:hypothetical protein